jgi:putative sterol carrier protein
MFTTVKEVFDSVRERIKANPNRVAGMTATYQFSITGEGGAEYYMKIVNGDVEIAEGTSPNPNSSSKLTLQDFLDMSNGKVSGQHLFFSGKMRVSGDPMLGMKLGQIMAP